MHERVLFSISLAIGFISAYFIIKTIDKINNDLDDINSDKLIVRKVRRAGVEEGQ